MINTSELAICTVHGNNPKYCGEFARRYAWPELQMKQIRKNTQPGFTVYVFGNNLMKEHEEFFRNCPDVVYFSSREIKVPFRNRQGRSIIWPIRNWLTRIAVKKHRYILHLDSDAFPLRDDWFHLYSGLLTRECPVVAVRRVENRDVYSDRCFLMFTREGFREHAFDFSTMGVVDAGAAISQHLEEEGLTWYPLLRSNRHNYHPLIAGIYDDRVYHHSAGTRVPRFRMNKDMGRRNIEWVREVVLHRLLMIRLFENTDEFIAELRGEVPPVDMESLVGIEVQKYLESEDNGDVDEISEEKRRIKKRKRKQNRFTENILKRLGWME
jgi:hypothetical protein